MRDLIKIVEDFSHDSKTVLLPAGHILYHGTNQDWNPRESHIRGPAWFGDEEMAEDYNSVMGHEDPTVLSYRTTKPLRLLDVSEGTEASEYLMTLWDDDVPPVEMAHACADAGYEGWTEIEGEIMIFDTSSLELCE